MTDRRTGRILLVEDEEVILNAFARHLSGSFQVDHLADGALAMQRLECGERYDAYVLDLRLPGVSGLDLVKWLAARDPEALRRVILLTGSYYDADVERSWPVARLIKPVSPKLLNLLVGRVVAGSSASEAAADLC